MSRISAINPEQATGPVKDIFGGIQKKMGKVFNIFQNMGNSPAVLKGFMAMSEAAGETSLAPELREEIALVVGQTNHCNYCLSAHTAIAHNQGLSENLIFQARRGDSADPKKKAILQFAKRVVENKAIISDEDVSKLRNAGVSEKEIVEIIFIISLNMFTNYFNHITDPEIDFPKAPQLN